MAQEDLKKQEVQNSISEKKKHKASNILNFWSRRNKGIFNFASVKPKNFYHPKTVKKASVTSTSALTTYNFSNIKHQSRNIHAYTSYGGI